MKNTLKTEIDTLAEQILITSKLGDADKLHVLARKLYEKTAVLQFFNSKPEVNTTPINTFINTLENNTITATNEADLVSALDEDLFVANEPIASDLLEPATEKMIDIVAQMEPETEQVDDLFQEITENHHFTKNDMEDVTPTQQDIAVSTETISKSLNDRLKKGITIGLNDRIAFVKHLFNNSTEDFNRVISQLNTLDSELDALNFLNTMVKPEYNNWEGKEEYEERFLTFIEGRY